MASANNREGSQCGQIYCAVPSHTDNVDIRKGVANEISKFSSTTNKNTLMEDVEKLGYSATGRKYGVSDNTIRKWIK